MVTLAPVQEYTEKAALSAEKERFMAPSTDTIISVQELWKTYEMGSEQVHALRGVNLQIQRNEYGGPPRPQ